MKQTGLLLLLVVVAVLYFDLSTAQGPQKHPQPKDQSPDEQGPNRQITKRAAQMSPDNMPMPRMPNPSDFMDAATKMGSMFSGTRRRFVRSPQGNAEPKIMYAGEAPSDDAEGEDESQDDGPVGHGPHGRHPFKHGILCNRGKPEEEQNE